MQMMAGGEECLEDGRWAWRGGGWRSSLGSLSGSGGGASWRSANYGGESPGLQKRLPFYTTTI